MGCLCQDSSNNSPGLVLLYCRVCFTFLSRTAHATKIDPALNAACRAITGCLKPTRVEDLDLLSEIAPPCIRKTVASQQEKLKQENDSRHPLHNREPSRKRLHSRHSFMHSAEPLDKSPENRRLSLWSDHLIQAPMWCPSALGKKLPWLLALLVMH